MFAIVIVSVSIFHSEYSEWNNHQDTIKIYETWSFVTDPARKCHCKTRSESLTEEFEGLLTPPARSVRYGSTSALC